MPTIKIQSYDEVRLFKTYEIDERFAPYFVPPVDVKTWPEDLVRIMSEQSITLERLYDKVIWDDEAYRVIP